MQLASNSVVAVASSEVAASGGATKNYPIYAGSSSAYVTNSDINGTLFGTGTKLGWSEYNGVAASGECHACVNASGTPLLPDCSAL